MKTRYYVVFVQHNKEQGAENRVAPSAFDTMEGALQKFHEQMGKDMKNVTLDWSVGYIVDNSGNTYRSERWTEPEPTEEEPEET